MKQSKKLYKFHVANLRSISDGLDKIFRSARKAIANRNQHVVNTYIRLLLFLLGAWSEVRFLKLIYEPHGFSQTERNDILKATQLERWQLAVKTAFRRHYGIPNAPLRPPRLPSTAWLRLTTLQEILRCDLGAVITMRNKLAHGQWEYPLNKRMNDVAQEQMNALRDENVLSLTQKVKLFDILCNVVHDLNVSRPTFERDWDMHFRRLEQTRTNIKQKSYKKWEAQIHKRYRRGRERRRYAREA